MDVQTRPDDSPAAACAAATAAAFTGPAAPALTAEAFLAAVAADVRRLADSMARRLRAWRVEADDLYQEGMLAAVRLAPQFDPARDRTPWQAAYLRVRGAMVDHLRAAGDETRAQIKAAMAAGAPRYTRLLSDVERERRRGRSDHRSNFQVACDDPPPVLDTAAELFEDAVAPLLASVLPEDRYILRAYWVRGLTMAEIAARLGRCESRVSQRHTRAVAYMRAAAAAKGLGPHDLMAG